MTTIREVEQLLGLHVDWDLTDEGEHTIHTLAPDQVPVSAAARVIYELRKDVDRLNAEALEYLHRAQKLRLIEFVRRAFPGIECPYCARGELVLVEQGHERQWDLSFDDGYSSGQITEEEVLTANFSGIEDYSEDGDGDYFTRCGSCLAEFQAPAEDWEWN
jgi:hypothetical protein